MLKMDVSNYNTKNIKSIIYKLESSKYVKSAYLKQIKDKTFLIVESK